MNKLQKTQSAEAKFNRGARDIACIIVLFYTVLSEEFVEADDANRCTAPIMADEDILKLVQSSKNIIDLDSDDENEMTNSVLFPTSSKMRSTRKKFYPEKESEESEREREERKTVEERERERKKDSGRERERGLLHFQPEAFYPEKESEESERRERERKSGREREREKKNCTFNQSQEREPFIQRKREEKERQTVEEREREKERQWKKESEESEKERERKKDSGRERERERKTVEERERRGLLHFQPVSGYINSLLSQSLLSRERE
ncbi:hypothetical protein TNCV_4279361 [Trichonephila clavipes]|nr:hypothetical protein TNCV_4279361 [Trichonephila clavipes]